MRISGEPWEDRPRQTQCFPNPLSATLSKASAELAPASLSVPSPDPAHLAARPPESVVAAIVQKANASGAAEALVARLGMERDRRLAQCHGWRRPRPGNTSSAVNGLQRACNSGASRPTKCGLRESGH